MENTSSLEPDWWAWVQSLSLPVPSWGLLGMSHSLFGLSFLGGRTKIPTSQYYLEKVKWDSRGEHSELCLAHNRHSVSMNYFIIMIQLLTLSKVISHQELLIIFLNKILSWFSLAEVSMVFSSATQNGWLADYLLLVHNKLRSFRM